MKNIKTSAHSYNHNQQSGQTESGVSKFDRYKYQDEEDDMDDGKIKMRASFYLLNSNKKLFV